MSGTIGSIEVKCHDHMSRMAMSSIIHLIEPVQLCNKMVHFQWNGFATEICLLLCLVLKQFSCFVHLSIHSFIHVVVVFRYHFLFICNFFCSNVRNGRNMSGALGEWVSERVNECQNEIGLHWHMAQS